MVAKREMPLELKGRLKEIMLNMHRQGEGKRVLKTLGIERFIPGRDSEYGPTREMIKAVGERG